MTRDNILELVAAGKIQPKEAASMLSSLKSLELCVTEKGCVQLKGDGLRRFGATFYPEEWATILDYKSEIVKFLADNHNKLAAIKASHAN